MLRAEDHPGDREIRDIVSIFATTRSARRARTKKGRRERKEKNGAREKQGNFRKETREIDSQPTSPMPSGILRLSAAWKSHGYAKLPPACAKNGRGIYGRKRERERERAGRRAGEKGEEEGGCEKIAETRLENPDVSRYFRAQKRYDAVPFRVPCALKRPSPGGEYGTMRQI